MLSLTVVVATYNRSRLLLKLFDDLSRQELRDPSGQPAFDVILVDDGSKEKVQPLLAGRKLGFPLRLIEQQNAGAAAARDRGIREATGDVIVILDDDMELPPGFLRAHLAQHEAGATVVLGSIRQPREGARLPLFERFHAWQLELQREAAQRGEPFHGNSLSTGNVSFRRADYLAAGGFDKALKHSEDRDLGIRLEQAGAKIVFALDAETVHHSDHASLQGFLRRAFLYGIYDSRIARKHPSLPQFDPWYFLSLVNPVSRPLLLFAACAPGPAAWLARAAMAISEGVGALGWESAALRGATLVYGLHYFRGVREEAGSLKATLDNLRAHRRLARR